MLMSSRSTFNRPGGRCNPKWTFNRPGVDVTNFIKLETMKAVIAKMDKKEPDKATQPL